MKNNSVLSVALRLFIITAIAVLCLAAVNMITKPIIDANSEKASTEAKMKVLPAAKEFSKALSFSEKDTPVAAENGVTIKEFNLGLVEKNGVGYVVTAVSNAGYGGDVEVMVGLDLDLKVVKAEIITSNETPGLGGNASKPEFIEQFNGKGGNLNVVKGGASGEDEISAISSATITSKAVTACVNAAVELVESKLAAGFTPTVVSDVQKQLEENQKETEQQLKDAESDNTGGAA